MRTFRTTLIAAVVALAAAGTAHSAVNLVSARPPQVTGARTGAHHRRAHQHHRRHRARHHRRHRHAARASGFRRRDIHLPPRTGTPTPTGPPAFTWLHTSGPRILNSANQPLRLIGVNEGAMYEGSAGALPDACGWTWRQPAATLGSDLQSWGFNAVKLTLSWSALEPTPPTVVNGQLVHHWDPAYLQMIDRTVADLGAHHIYAIPVLTQEALSPAFKRYDGSTCEGSGMPTWLFPNATREDYISGWCDFFGNQQQAGVPERPIDGFVAAWQELASRYATNATVAAVDLMNEPGTALECGWRHISKLPVTYLDDLDRRVGTAIRSVDPNVLLIMEDENESEGPDGHMISSTDGLTNVVYEWHNYATSWATGQPPLADELAFARRINAPLLLGEFDAFNADDNGAPPVDPNWQGELTAMMAYLKQNDVSWLIENYDGRWSLKQPVTGLPKQPLMSLLQAGLGEPATLPSVARGSDIGSTPGSAWPILQAAERW